jgi:transposase
MGAVSIIGIDLAKHSFAVHGVDARGQVVLRKSLRRDKVSAFFANLPPCLVGMEACAGSAHWARVIAGHGHEVRRMHARFVTPYRMADKNDASDAAAICEAVQRPRMRFVPGKSREQADIQSVHRVRSGLVRARTAAINQARGLLGEYGIVIKQGAGNLRGALPQIIAEQDNGLSGTMRRMLVLLYEHIASLDAQIASLDTTLKELAKEHEACQRLQKIPGVGFLGATILLAVAGAAKEFKNGRQFAAYLGLVPRQHSTGGKPRLLGITKRGDSYVRTVLIHGARAVLNSMRRGYAPLGAGAAGAWLAQLVERRGPNKACVALANKLARIAWNMLALGTEYRMAA